MNAKKAFLGEWRITETELWDLEDLDLVTQATLSLKPNGRGRIAVIAIEAQLDYRAVTRDGLPGIEFSFHGFDEGDEVMGRGWAVLKGEELEGRALFPSSQRVVIPRSAEANTVTGVQPRARKREPIMNTT